MRALTLRIFLEKLERISQKERQYKFKIGRKSIYRLSNRQEITIAK